MTSLKKRVKATATLGILLGCFLFHYPSSAEQSIKSPQQLAIVIDDFGNDMSGTVEMLNLPIPLTVAIMPFQSTTKRDAAWAREKGKQVIVHLPMEPLSGRTSGMGPGAIMTDMSDAEIRRKVKEAIDDVPYAVGVNNHMGSKATTDERVMKIVLEVCKERGFFFLDSKTNYRSIVARLAKQKGVKYTENHLFLDDVVTVKHITKQVEKIKEHLESHDHCVAIGHVGTPGKKTAYVLQKAISELHHEVDFVPITKLLN